MNFAIANPARQVFFTVVTREEKYKAKNLIDVVIYRGSDAFYGWMFGSSRGAGAQDRSDRAVRAAGGSRLARPVGGAGTDAGTPRCAGGSGGGAGRLRMIRITRRDFAALAGVALLARKASAQNDAAPLIERAIPSSGERLPAVGLGTANVFDSDDERTRQRRRTGHRDAGRGRRPGCRHGVVLWRGGERARRCDRPRRLARQALHRDEARDARRSGTEALADPAQDGEPRPLAAPQRARSAAIPGAVQGVAGARPLPLHRHHLHLPRRFRRGRGGARTRAAGFRADRLFARRPRSGETHPAAGGRGQGRRC